MAYSQNLVVIHWIKFVCTKFNCEWNFNIIINVIYHNYLWKCSMSKFDHSCPGLQMVDYEFTFSLLPLPPYFFKHKISNNFWWYILFDFLSHIWPNVIRSSPEMLLFPTYNSKWLTDVGNEHMRGIKWKFSYSDILPLLHFCNRWSCFLSCIV